MKEVVRKFRILRYRDKEMEEVEDLVVVESLIRIYLNGEKYLQMPYTPKDTKDLVYGILFSEGFIRKMEDVLNYKEDGNTVYVELEGKGLGLGEIKGDRDRFAYEVIKGEILPLDTDKMLSLERILSLVKDFQALPSIYKDTGGTHSSAIAGDEILYWAEDISRRNAIYKVIGKAFLRGDSLRDKILIVSCRVPSDVVLRAIKVGIPTIVSISSPTDRAVKIARNFGVMICGFARGKRINVYSCFERVIP